MLIRVPHVDDLPAQTSTGIDPLRVGENNRSIGAGVADLGGLNRETAAHYLALPNVPMVGGAWMVPAEALAARDWALIEARSRDAARLAR